jgi:feruloyl esterase
VKLAEFVFAAILMNMLSSQASAGATCESLASLSLGDTTIKVAQTVAAGALRLPTALPDAGPHGGITFVAAKDLPEFCRVVGVAKPSKDSEIKFEVWMSTSNWNGNFMGLGNGGMGGSISYGNMSAPLSRGYATASTDTGHESTGQDGSYALGHRERVIDFGYRAAHEMTVNAKLIVAAYYGRSPKFSYWYGCSTGGRQALAEAQRFPADYNGIVAGAAAIFLTHMQAASVWKAQVIRKNPGGVGAPLEARADPQGSTGSLRRSRRRQGRTLGGPAAL